MNIKQIQGGYDSNFFYILESNGDVAVIDCFDANFVLDYIKSNSFKLKYVMSTHSHFDHVEGNQELLNNTDAKLVMHKSNECDLPVDEGSVIQLGSEKIEVLYTPGHLMDCVCFLVDKKLFTGDTLFVKTIGGLFCEEGPLYQPKTIKRLMKLDDSIFVYPGHNYGGKSATIKEIRKKNPRVLEIISF